MQEKDTARSARKTSASPMRRWQRATCACRLRSQRRSPSSPRLSGWEDRLPDPVVEKRSLYFPRPRPRSHPPTSMAAPRWLSRDNRLTAATCPALRVSRFGKDWLVREPPANDPLLPATHAFSRRPLSRAYRSFIGPILKDMSGRRPFVMSGRRPFVKGLVEALRTYRVRSCLRPVGAGNEYPAGPDAGPHGSSPNQQNALVMAPALFLGLPSRSVGSHRFAVALDAGSPCGETSFLLSLLVQAATGRSS